MLNGGASIRMAPNLREGMAMPEAGQGKSLFVVLPNLNIWNADNPGSGQAFLRSASRQLHAGTHSPVALSRG